MREDAVTKAIAGVRRVAVIGAGTIGASWAANFLARGGTSVTGQTNFVAAVYQDLLGRVPESTGLDHWLMMLEAGMSRQTVVSATELAHVPGAEEPGVARLAIAEGHVLQAAEAA